jgi:hypothetical protein
MSYKTGKSKPLEEITLEDVLENKIWEWALDEESEENQDETWQRPILDCENVTAEIFNPTITLKIKDSEIYASAEFDNETESLNAISIWVDNEWKILDEFTGETPITFIALPKINGIANVEFLCENIFDDMAEKI